MWTAPAVMMLCTLLAYIDRQTLAVLSPTILQDTGLSAKGYGDALFFFSIAYMIANPLWGSVLDYVGLRLGMLVSVGIWTIASVAHAWVAAFAGFAIFRTILGIGEGAAFPGAFKTAMESLPPNLQSRGMALGYSGASLGNLITPLIVIPIVLRFGWRSAFLVTGAFGAAWLLLWWRVARPPLLRPAPRGLQKFVWPNLLDRHTWLVMATFGLGGFGLGVVLYWAPLYLNRGLGFTQAQLVWIIPIPSIGYAAGYYFWGWIADRYIGSDMRRATRIFLMLTVLALPPALIAFVSPALAVALFFWAVFIADGFIMTALRVGARIFPPEHSTVVGGLGSGAWSAVLAVAQPVYGRWFDLHWYGLTFVSMALVPILGTLVWLALSGGQVAARPLTPIQELARD